MAAGLMLPLIAHANQRATQGAIAKRAAQSESLWEAPASNYAAIVSVFIKPGTISRDDALRRLASMQEKAGNSQEKAALNYLTGEAYYWGGLADLRRTRDKSVLLGLGNNTVGAYLTAWTAVTNAGSDAATLKLRQTIVSALNQVLATEVCGSTLATNLMRQVVSNYIDALEGDAIAASVWASPALRSKAYINLGIQSRLVEKIPATMPTNFLAVCEAMDLAIAVGATNEALRFAANLQSVYADELAKKTFRWRKVYALYRDVGDPRAEACVKALSAIDPKGWLDLYDYSVRRDPLFPEEQRRKCLDEYFKGLEAQHARRIGAYLAAVEQLMANNDFGLAIEVADAALDPKQRFTLSTDIVLVTRLKAMAHEKRGEADKAAKAYARAVSDAPFVAGGEELMKILPKPVPEASRTNGKEGESK